MLYYLTHLSDVFSWLNLFRYITFRASMAAVTAFFLCIIFGPWVIQKLRSLKILEVAKRKDCPDLDVYQGSKEGTPTMGGVFIVGSIILSSLLWADITNIYVVLTLGTMIYLSILGGIDDYVKLTRKGERGLSKKIKILWEILLGCFIGSYVYFNPSISTLIDVPFLKNLVVDVGFVYILMVAFIIIGTSNAVNLTDGLDGLAIGCVVLVSLTLAILSYLTGNLNFSEYLLIPHVVQASELTVVCFAIIGASLGFLWFNCYPASIFMGDVGSLSLGGTLGVIAILIKKELLLIIMGGVFTLEAVTVILQIASVKMLGKRIFKIAPIHHCFQLKGMNESQIVIRFWIVGIIFALITLTTLKIR